LADFGTGGNGGAGFVALRYADTYDRLSTVGAGLTYTVTTSGGYHIYQFTAGSDTIRV
jgi:NAD(P)H-hydrate repair Nnr-like enzyme with NAD(P)H-hydrate epimerase domain